MEGDICVGFFLRFQGPIDKLLVAIDGHPLKGVANPAMKGSLGLEPSDGCIDPSMAGHGWADVLELGWLHIWTYELSNWILFLTRVCAFNNPRL